MDELDPTTSEASTESETDAESCEEEESEAGMKDEKETEPCHALVPVAKTTEEKAVELKNST